MYDFTFRVTDNCDLSCRHCAFECGPGGETISSSDMIKALEHLPKTAKEISITGGEALTVLETIRPALLYLKEHKERILPVRTGIGGVTRLMTNGSFIEDVDSAYKVLKSLDDLGIDELFWSGNDIFHEEQGIDVGKAFRYLAKARARLVNEMSSKAVIEIKTDSVPLLDVTPLGRAKSLPKDMFKKEHFCFISGFFKDSIIIDPKGQAHFCCWEVPPPIGSAIETSIEELVHGAMADPIMNALLKGGPLGVAKKLGILEQYDPAYVRTPCVKCEEIFTEYF